MDEGAGPDEVVEHPGSRHRRPRRVAGAAGAVGLAVGVAVGVATLAGAATDPGSGTTTTTGPPAASADPAPGAPPPGAPPLAPEGGRFGGHGHGRGGPGAGIHGEFVVPAPSGGFETLDSQVGQVTDVSATSITVKSADNFEKTYVVDEGTVVNAGRDGIANVQKGETVEVVAVVADKTAKAVEIRDATSLDAHRKTWAPPRPGRGAPDPGSTPPTTTG
ncbi:MAG: hypothetical protein QOG64_179 [Acidimicrobiaceae bacterium]|jgi:hypothetical protein|nr:hypothetical protein [Acidimicrobiaceae bacterium]